MSDAKAFQHDIVEIGWRYGRLAAYLGIAPETLRVWRKEGPPEVARLAVEALASGWRPSERRKIAQKGLGDV